MTTQIGRQRENMFYFPPCFVNLRKIRVETEIKDFKVKRYFFQSCVFKESISVALPEFAGSSRCFRIKPKFPDLLRSNE